MIRCRFCCSRKYFNLNNIRNASSSFYVLLPEVPPDTPTTNPVMRTDNVPSFKQINPDNCITGCAKLAINYDIEFGKHVENLKDPNFPKTFPSVFEPIEKIGVPLNTAWRTVKNLNYVAADEYRIAFQRIHPQVERARNERWISEPLYNAVKEVAADRQNLNEEQRRLVEMYLLEARLNGIQLTGTDKLQFTNILSNLINAKNHFRNRVMLSHNMFSHIIDDFQQVIDMPKSFLTQIAYDKFSPERGPWKVTLNPNVYNPFLEYCSHRLLRWNLWQANNNRASIGQDQQNLSNHIIIKDIRQHRKDLANLLGYENFAAMSMETKMAGSVENVMNLIENLKSKCKPLAYEEITELQQYATSEGFKASLEMWDVPYWRRRQKESIYKVDHEAVADHLPLPRVLQGLFSLCDTLFGITVKDCSGEVDTWEENVKFYRVYDKESSSEIAAFYLDPYGRPLSKLVGSWMESGLEYTATSTALPYSYMNLNLAPPVGSQPTLLTVEEASTLFYEFGHGLQQMMTTVPYSELSGQRNIEWDALQVCAMLMSMFFYHPTILRSISSHHITGEPLSEQLINDILKERQHMNAYDTIRQLYISAFDMEMYISDEVWQHRMRAVWEEFMPIPLHEDDNHPCSMTAIFSDQYPAAYYSVKWAEMIAADIFKAFEEVGFEDKDKLAIVGKRFRETFLSLGGSVPANEVFRRFRGRDPSQDAIIKQYST